MASYFQIAYAIDKLKEKIKQARTVRTVKYDDKEVKNFSIGNFVLDAEKLDFTMQFTPADSNTALTVSALHYFRSSREDVIKVNNDNATNDDVDMDVDIHLLRADFEYRLSYEQSGKLHNIFMLASVDWFS
jgi:hypothetical protein